MRSRRIFKGKIGRKLWLIVPLLALIGGVYLLVTTLAPVILPAPSINVSSQSVQPDAMTENRLYIPKIGVDVLITEGDSEAALDKGAWHRKPENGSPARGGNFVLSAHRFQMGWTPDQTRDRSPFYHIDKLQEGDEIYVDYNQKRYSYIVTKKYAVDRYAVYIESPSEEAKMTLYSCTLEGEAAGRDVIEAHPTRVAP